MIRSPPRTPRHPRNARKFPYSPGILVLCPLFHPPIFFSNPLIWHYFKQELSRSLPKPFAGHRFNISTYSLRIQQTHRCLPQRSNQYNEWHFRHLPAIWAQVIRLARSIKGPVTNLSTQAASKINQVSKGAPG